MAGNEIYDRLAKVLKDVHERFPADAFAKHQRLRGMLADHLQSADREIRITLDVIDEGVVKVLTETPASERGMQIDRLASRLDTSRGIREDIARQIIQAFAYALNLGGLPSTLSSQRGPAPVTPQQPGQDWVGLSETVQPPPPPPPPGGDIHGTKPQSLSDKLSKNKNGVMLASAALVIGALYFSNQGQNLPTQDPAVGDGGGVPVEVGTVPGADGNLPQGQEGQPEQGQGAQSPQGQGGMPQGQGGVPPQGQGGAQPQGPGPQVQGGTPQPAGGQQGGAAPTQQPQQQGGAQGQQAPAQQGQQPQAQGTTAQSLWYDPYGQIWQMQYSGNQFQGTTNAGGNVVGLMGQFNSQDNTIQYQVFDASGQAVWQGQGQFADQTHISFVTTDLNGNVVGQGQFHIDHPPSQ